jgi:hypothetical protein
VVVYDDTGRYEALSVAEAVLEAGAHVTFISAHDSLGATVPFPGAVLRAVRERLYGGEFDFCPTSHLASISERGVSFATTARGRIRTVPADAVVMVGYNRPERQLAESLSSISVPFHVVGDAAGGTSLQTAIHQGSAMIDLLRV